MTYEDLARAISLMDEDERSRDAIVWLGNVDYKVGEHVVIGISRYDISLPVSKSNRLSLDIEEW